MTADLSEFRPITYYGDESVSPTAVGPTPLAPPPPEPPAEDDSADMYPVTAEELRSVSQFGEGSEAELISPKTAYAGASWWSGAEEPFFTSRIAEDFITPPDALFGLEQIDETREEGLLESLQTALPNVLDTSKRPYNIYSMPVWTSPMWNEVGKHHVWHQRTDHPSGAFFAAVLSFEQIVENEGRRLTRPARQCPTRSSRDKRRGRRRRNSAAFRIGYCQRGSSYTRNL